MNGLIAAAFLVFSILLCYSVAGAQSDPAGFTPVPKEKIDGSTLILKEANCTFAAPTPDWRWLEPVIEKGKNYMCFNPKTGGAVTVSVGELLKDLDEHTRKEIEVGAIASALKQGFKVANNKMEAAAIPVPGHSWRFSYENRRSDGRMLVTILYLARTAEKILVTVQGFSADGNDTPTFKTFVSSVKLISEFPQPVK